MSLYIKFIIWVPNYVRWVIKIRGWIRSERGEDWHHLPSIMVIIIWIVIVRVRSWSSAALSFNTLPVVFEIWWVHLKILNISILKIVVNFVSNFFFGVRFGSEQVLEEAHVMDVQFIIINLVLCYECFQVRILNLGLFKSDSVLHECNILLFTLWLLKHQILGENLVLIFERVLRE